MPKPTRPDDKRLAVKPVSERYRHKMFSFSPELAGRLSKWQADNPKQTSLMIAKFIDEFLTERGY